MRRGQVVEDKGNPVFAACVHHAVVFLVVDLVSMADFEAMWFSIDHETHAGIGCDRHMDAVAVDEGSMAVAVWCDNATGFELGGHGANDRATGWIVFLEDTMHQGHGRVFEQVPRWFACDLNLRPTSAENHHQRLSMLMYRVRFLPVLLGSPIRIFTGQDGVNQRLRINPPQLFECAFKFHLA